jgi:hypothetical protein
VTGKALKVRLENEKLFGKCNAEKRPADYCRDSCFGKECEGAHDYYLKGFRPRFTKGTEYEGHRA